MIIVIDGPEKAGKTTLIDRLGGELYKLGYKTLVRKWGSLSTDDREYTPALQADSTDSLTITLWDRSWVSEYVYSTLSNRNHRLNNDPWLGEWLHRRALFNQGFGVILLPIVPGLNNRFLDSFDLHFPGTQEYDAFDKYARDAKWMLLYNSYTTESLYDNITAIVNRIETIKNTRLPIHPEQMVNPGISRILFIGDQSIDQPFPGQWLPFTSGRLTRFARKFGIQALAGSWTGVYSLDVVLTGKYQFFVTTGKSCEQAISKYKLFDNQQIIKLTIPAPGFPFTQLRIMESIQTYLGKVWNATNYI